MTIELLLRVIGYLSLFGALLYLAYLFAPPAFTERLSRQLKALSLEEEEESPLDLPAWGRYMSDREGYDSEHAARIAMLARQLGQAAGLPPDVLDTLEQAGYLHDLGEEDLFPMLDKASPLTPAEREKLREHPLIGERLARDIGMPPEPALWVRWHHERVDGTGYPDGLMGDAIPLPARILAIAEAYEAITHRRPFREALEPDEALAELQRLAGIAYDPRLIDSFANNVYPRLITPPTE